MAQIPATRSLCHRSSSGKWVVFYASGRSGKLTRADSKGGLLARGWWRRDNHTMQHHGPFTSLEKAKKLS